MTQTPEQEHIQRLIDAYVKSPELLARLTDALFMSYGDSHHDFVCLEIKAMVGRGMPEVCGKLADVILDVAKNQTMKENNERKGPNESM